MIATSSKKVYMTAGCACKNEKNGSNQKPWSVRIKNNDQFELKMTKLKNEHFEFKINDQLELETMISLN